MPSLPLSNDCCCCGACVDICPKQAISWIEDKNTFYCIRIDKDKCVECGKCESHCHILHLEKLRFSEPHNVNPLAAWSTDEDMLKHSASGAIFAQVAKNMLEEGNTYAYGASLLDDNTVKHIEISSVRDLYLLQNSKYQQSITIGIFAKVKKRLKERKRVLFSGVPCQVAALLSFLNYDERLMELLYTIEIVCHGIPCNDLHRTALRFNGQKKIVSYRTKGENGWMFGCNNRVTYEDFQGNRMTTESFVKDSLYRSYLSFAFIRPNCYSCHYANIRRVSDLTIGDYWGVEKSSMVVDSVNKNGVSLVLPNTEKGLLMMKGKQLYVLHTLWRDILPYNQNLFMPTNEYHFIWSNYIWLIKRMPVILKTFLYQNGFNYYKLNSWYEKSFQFVFGKYKGATEEKERKLHETIDFLEKK